MDSIDLIDGGIDHGVWDGRRIVEFPSALFVAKCVETIRSTPGHYPPV